MKPFAELSGSEKAIEVLRWALVAPAAVLGIVVPACLASLLVPRAVAQLPGTPPPTGAEYRYVLLRILSIFMGAIFVIAGARMAPRWRPTTAIVLASLWISYSFMSHVLVHLGQGTPHYLDFFGAVAAAACGAAAFLFSGKNGSRTHCNVRTNHL